MEIYLVRHTSVETLGDTCYGHADVALAGTFEEEAAKVMQVLPKSFDKIYCSPAIRCHRLALKFEHEVTIENDLIEMNFGDWERCKWNDINAQELDRWMKDFVTICPPNGENLNMLYYRVSQFLEALRNQKFNKVLIVTHAGVLRCIWAYLLAIPLQNIFKINVALGEVLKIQINENKDLDKIVWSKNTVL